ncbi:hypothetical protein CT19431_MP130207 [Cupriavidus taiwanensis]|nr:hypothetical protein CT19431_MP130207 [Cupriavidus taiwanensis]
MAGTINCLGDDAKLGALDVRAQLTGFASASPFSLAACLRSGAAGRGSSSLR